MNKKRQLISIILKMIVIVFGTLGVVLSATNYGAYNLFYFTLQSNIAIVVACTVGLVFIILQKLNKKVIVKKWMFVVKYVLTIAITLTGFVFCAVLLPTLDPALDPSLIWNFPTIACHIVVPIASIADFFVFDCFVEYKKKYCVLNIIPPLYYLAFATIGYVSNWDFGLGKNYPYFFLNWNTEAGIIGFSNQLPYMAPPYWGTLLLAFVVALGGLYIFFANKIRTKNSAEAKC